MPASIRSYTPSSRQHSADFLVIHACSRAATSDAAEQSSPVNVDFEVGYTPLDSVLHYTTYPGFLHPNRYSRYERSSLTSSCCRYRIFETLRLYQYATDRNWTSHRHL